ncbi:hypothetical protein [Paractinoplanes lichenicola]|uniref:Uncharacterized protein n=1 Tax=Paractinoplanes lichenicola TaxID=2802976 RepID=A0ABS1VN26_9ACTN|nr:hypothetical protein [Actinoplanes lichenicola]MBL7256003.1 hypothetical protein [Actinoplanes lichenicola]
MLYGQEKALLTGGLSDLTERTRALARVADTLDPDWGIETAAHDGLILHTIVPKHERAAEVSPISFSFQGAFGAEHADIRRSFDQIVRFGSNDTVVLPPEITQRLTFTGPDWLAPQGPYELTLKPIDLSDRIGTEAKLHMLDSDGHRRSSYQAGVSYAGAGSSGYSIDLQIQNDTKLRLKVGDDGVTLQADFSLHAWTPQQALQTIGLHRNLLEFSSCELEIGGQVMSLLRPDLPVPDQATMEALADIELLADDLDIVQRHARTFFPIPERISITERIDIRLARLLVEGHCVQYRGAREFTATMNGRYDPTLKALLSEETVSMRVDADTDIFIGANRVSLGRLLFFHTQTQIENRHELQAALEAGRGNGTKAKFAPKDRERFNAVMLTARPGRNEEPLVPTPWGLPGIDGPAALKSPGKSRT